MKKFSFLGKLSIIFIIFLICFSLLGKVAYTKAYDKPSGKSLESPSKEHILGTDDLGIDILAQIIYGSQISLFIGFTTAIISGLFGSIVGMLSGYYGGRFDNFIMRLIDVLISLPELPLMILIGAFLGPSIKNIIIVLSLFSWTRPAKIARSKILSIKQEDYILVAKSYGANFLYLTRKHFIKDLFPLISISIIKITSKAIIAESGLSFLGLGDPTSKTWGIILNHAIGFKGIYFTNYWKWWVMSPLLFIICLVLSMAFISRDLERILEV